MSDGTPLPNRTAETPVSGRDYPEDDPEGRRWSEIWRAAVEELNANALVSDLGTNRLDYSPEDGTLFVPSDGGDWYLGDGAGWNNLGAIGDIDNHVADTTNPHSVTSDQVGSPSDAEFTSHTSDTTNPHSVTATQSGALPTSGGTMTGDVTFGEGSVETISGTGATLSFTGDNTRDIHDVTDVTLSNSSGASVTEDVTLNYYQGVDNTGTLVESQTQSVTLADAASTTVQFLTADFSLDNVDYFLEVTTTALTTDSIEEVTMGASYATEQTSTGDLVTTDQNGRERARYGATSESVSFPTVEADGVQTADIGTAWNAREFMLQHGYSNIAPAINALIDEILADQVGGGKIVIPHPRSGDPGVTGNDWALSETISVPYHFAREQRIALIGAGMGAVTMRPEFTTNGPVIQKEPAGQNADGSSQDAGFMIQGLSIRDLDGVATKLIDVNDILHGTIRDCTLQGSATTSEVIHCHGPDEGAFFSLIDNCRISKADGTTGIRLGDDADPLGANASTIRHCEMTGAIGTSIGIDIDFAGSSNIIGGNTDNAGTAIRISKNGVGVFGHRFEAPYGETNADSNIITPIDIVEGAESAYINPNIRHGITNTGSPNDPPRDFVRASNWGGQYNEFDMGVISRWAVDHGGGAAGQPHWIYDGSLGSTAPTRNLGQIKLTTAATSGDDVRYFAQNLSDGSQLSRLDFSANLGMTADHVTILGWQNDVNNRAVFIADPNDTLTTGITANWMAQTVQGGSAVGGSPTDTGVAIDTSQHVFSVVPEKEAAPYRWRYLIDGTTVATHEDGTLDGDIGWSGPNAEIETLAAASKTLRVRSIVPRILGAGGSQKL